MPTTATPSTFPGISLTVNTETHRIEDADGRERVFHGTNVVFKGPPYYPPTAAFDPFLSLAEQDLQLLSSMGYNSIRLGVLWAGAEPTEGLFNETFFAQVNAIVERAGRAYGIYSLLDMHQDDLNEKYCGEGVPDWAAVSEPDNFPLPLAHEPYPLDPQTGWPAQSLCDTKPWAGYQFTYALNNATGRLYRNVDGLRDKFVRFWGKVAEHWAGSQYVLGYELLNEPWAGDVIADPELLVPGVTDRKYLQPMYDDINTAIRAVDREHLILFQGVTWEIFGIGERYGFEHVPGGPAFRNKSVLAFHNSIEPAITPDSKYYTLRWGEVVRLGGAGWVTESGADQSDLDDAYGLSWMHWEYKPFVRKTGWSYGLYNSDGSLNEAQVALYARTYAPAVAGTTQRFVFNITTGAAELVYTIKPRCTQPTIIYLSEQWHYPRGFTVALSPPAAAAWQHVSTNYIHITHTPPVAPVNLTVTIRAL